MTPIELIAAIWLPSCAFLAWIILTAPEGYQDDEGFHLSNQPHAAEVTPPADTGTPA